MRRIYKNTRYGLLFFERKVSQRTSHKTRHFILAKAFEFPKDFPRKVLWSGFGRNPQLIMHTKSTALPCFFIFRDMLELRSKPCFKGLLKKSLENPQNFYTEYTTLFWQKLLKFQETFPEKFLVSGFGADAPTDNEHKKRGHTAFFILS